MGLLHQSFDWTDQMGRDLTLRPFDVLEQVLVQVMGRTAVEETPVGGVLLEFEQPRRNAIGTGDGDVILLLPVQNQREGV